MPTTDEHEVALIQLESAVAVDANEDWCQPLGSARDGDTAQIISLARAQVSDHGRQHNGNLNVNGTCSAKTRS